MSAAGYTFLVIALSVTVIGEQLIASSSHPSSSPPASASPLHSSSSSLSASSSSSSSTSSTSTQQTGSPGSDSMRSSQKTKEVTEALEAGLMKMFGLRTRPKPAAQVHVPQYLLKLYSSHFNLQNSEYSDGNTGKIQMEDTDMFAGNTVRSFYHQDNMASDDTLDAAEDEERASHRVHCRFNITSIPEDEVIKAGQLQIFRHQDLTHVGKYRMDVHEIIHPASTHGEPITRLIDTKIVNPKHSAWESFDVRSAVKRWKEAPHLNHGLEVHISSTKTRKPLTSHSVRLRRSVDMDDNEWETVQPLLVTFSDDENASHLRTKRASNRRKNRRKSNDEGDRRSNKKSRRRNSRRRKRREECRRHELYVDFSDVGWNDWIVAPPGYMAYYCQGECNFPLQDYLNATNHAIVQTLVHSVSPESAPKPCCVPTELAPISMLYIDEGRAVVKSYQQMVVIGCGCR